MEEKRAISDEEKAKQWQIQQRIEEKVTKLERSNYINKKLSPEEMVKRIKKIVEEEVK